MFHIPNDKRAFHSAKMICDGLSVCLQRKSFAEISVTEICAAAKVGRTTFYRLFDNPTDILVYQYEETMQQLLQRHHAQSSSLAQIMIDLIIGNQPLTELIVRSGRMDILIESHRKYYDQLIEHLPPGDILAPQESEYFISILSSFMLGVVSIWGHSEKKPDHKELYSYLKKVYKQLGNLF